MRMTASFQSIFKIITRQRSKSFYKMKGLFHLNGAGLFCVTIPAILPLKGPPEYRGFSRQKSLRGTNDFPSQNPAGVLETFSALVYPAFFNMRGITQQIPLSIPKITNFCPFSGYRAGVFHSYTPPAIPSSKSRRQFLTAPSGDRGILLPTGRVSVLLVPSYPLHRWRPGSRLL